MIDNHTSGMIRLVREAITMPRITVSLPEEQLLYLNQLAKQWDTTRSGAVLKILEKHQKKIQEQLMVEGYKEMSLLNQEEANLAFPAQAEVVLRD